MIFPFRKSQLPKSSHDIRILFHRIPYRGAMNFIEEGLINGFKIEGVGLVVWDAHKDHPRLTTILEQFRPTHFIGSLQEPSRATAAWTIDRLFHQLLEYKKKNGLQVALRSIPSNIKDLSRNMGLNFEHYPEAGVKSYYLPDEKPNSTEEAIIKTGFIDLIRSPLYHEVFPVVFKNFLNLGLPILEEPHAADDTRYHLPMKEIKPNIDLLFIGGCWPFKWENMKNYVLPLKKQFKDKFLIYGKGWPQGLTKGYLNEEQFVRKVTAGKINLSLHEPSQVLSFPFSGNERIYKLLLLKAFVISDPNPVLKYHFTDGEDIVLAKNPDDMIQLVEYYLQKPDKRQAMADSGQKKVLGEHTYHKRTQRLLSVLKDNNKEKIIPYKPLREARAI